MDRLVKEAAAQGTDPDFAGEMNRMANLLAIPLPAAVASDGTRRAVARRCTELAAEGDLRGAAALLAGYLLAAVRWERAHARSGPLARKAHGAEEERMERWEELQERHRRERDHPNQ